MVRPLGETSFKDHGGLGKRKVDSLNLETLGSRFEQVAPKIVCGRRVGAPHLQRKHHAGRGQLRYRAAADFLGFGIFASQIQEDGASGVDVRVVTDADRVLNR